MKRVLIILAGLTLALSTQSQTILTFKSHGLKPDVKNPMIITKYVDPGQGGQNLTWDFSGLEATNNFEGNLIEPSIIKGGNRFSSANVSLEEFGSFFFFNSNSRILEQYGYSSSNSNFTIEYSKPFVKMRYPFSFNSAYSGVFEGKYFSEEKVIADIIGTYQVEGDAIGTLLLPENKSFRNALRVKEIKSYNQVANGNTTRITETSYRWYVNEHRFPILVLINCDYTFANGQTSSSTKAAYNSNVLISNSNQTTILYNYILEVFPNPYYEKVNINLQIKERSKINITVYDLIGKKVAVLADKVEEAGDLTFNFSAKELGLARGTYIVKVRVNNNETTRKILEL